MFRSVLVIALLGPSNMMAADFSGRWAGTLETSGNRVPIYFSLNEHDGKIGGSVATDLTSTSGGGRNEAS